MSKRTVAVRLVEYRGRGNLMMRAYVDGRATRDRSTLTTDPEEAHKRAAGWLQQLEIELGLRPSPNRFLRANLTRTSDRPKKARKRRTRKPAFTPSPTEIAAACAEIRSGQLQTVSS